MQGGLQWALRRRLTSGRGLAGWAAGILLTLFTIASLIAAFVAWRMAQEPVALTFAIPQIEEALSPTDGSLAVEVGGLHLRREGLSFLLEAENMAVYRVSPTAGRAETALATLPLATIRLSVQSLLQDGILAPDRVTAEGLLVSAERGDEGIEISFGSETEANVDQMRLSVLRQLLRDDPRLRYLKSVELRDLTFRVRDPTLGIAWEALGANMRFVNGPAGLVWHGEVGLATRHDTAAYFPDNDGLIGWHLTLTPDSGAQARDGKSSEHGSARLTVDLERVQPSTLIELVPGLKQIVDWQGAVTGTLQTEFATDALPTDISFGLTAAAGRLALPGTQQHLAFDKATTAGQLSLAERRLRVDDLVLSRAGLEARLRGSGSLQGEDQVRVWLEGEGLNLAWLSDVLPGLDVMKRNDVVLHTQIDAVFQRGGEIDHADLFLETEPGRIELAGLLPGPVALGNSSMQLRIGNRGREIELQRLHLSLPRGAEQPDLPITVTGSAVKGGEGRLTVDAGALDIADLKRLWPIGVGEGGRVWIVEQVHEGRVPGMTAEISFHLPEGPGLVEPEDVHVDARMPLRDVTLTYWPPLPNAEDIDADARITEKLFEAQILRGVTSGMQVSGGNLQITGIDKGKGYEHTTIAFDVGGPVNNLMAILDRPPLGFASYLNLPPDRLEGTISGRLKAEFPPVADLDLEDVTIEATGATRGLKLPEAAFDEDLTQGRIAFSVNKTALSLEGEASLADVPIALQGDLRFADAAPFRSRFRVQGTMTDVARERLGFTGFPFSQDVVSGPVGIEMTATEPVRGATMIEVAADLTEAAVVLAPLDWRSPAGEYAAVNAQVRVASGRLQRIDNFRVTAPQLSVAGDVEWPADAGAVPTVRIGELRLGAGTSVTALGMAAPEGGYRVSIAGARLDARALFDSLMQSEDESAGDGASQQAGQPEQTGTDRLAIDLSVEAVKVGSGAPLQGVRGVANLAGGELQTVSLAAETEGGGQLSVEVQENGAAALNATDAGALLASLGISERLNGGTMQINAQLPADRSPITGTALLWGGVFREAPFVMRLFGGEASDRPDLVRSWPLDRFDTGFQLHRGILTLEDGRVSGGELGATFQGWVDLNRNALDISGAIIPVYSVNRVLRSIPLIGDVLTDGEGLFAANYRATGSLSEPDFNVNPLTALAPGLLRRLFGNTASDPPKGN